MSNSDSIPLEDASSHSSPVSLTPEEHDRLELLKHRKNLERQEKERAIWREASKPLRTFGMDDWDSEPPRNSSPEVAPKKEESSFFTKLRLGRFLG